MYYAGLRCCGGTFIQGERLFYLAFENDVILYGSQTFHKLFNTTTKFENDVILYGSQTNN